MGYLDDFGELYSDLDAQVTSGVPVAEEEGRDKSDSEEDDAQRAHGPIENGSSSSDSDDDIHIVLNDEDSPNKLPHQLIGDDVDDEEDEGDELIVVTGSGYSSKKRKLAETGLSVDGFLSGNGETKRAHRIRSRPFSGGSAIRAWDILSGRAHWDQLTTSGTLGNGSYSVAFPVAFSNGYDFCLPQNRSIFDIDVEWFEYKPWRFNGVDITDYFNFGLDEQGWKSYCKQLVLFQQNKFPMCESSKLNKTQSSRIISADVAHCGVENGLLSIPDGLDVKRTSVRLPKGRAIQVESGNGERVPSIEARRSRNRDSDAVIQITTGTALGDASDPSMKRINHAGKTATNTQSFSSSNNELCESTFSGATCSHKCEGTGVSSEGQQLYVNNLFANKNGVLERLDDSKCNAASPSRDMSLSKPDPISSDQFCNSPKFSDHGAHSEASKDGVCMEKVTSPGCVHLSSGSLSQEFVSSDFYFSCEAASDTSNADHRSCPGDSPDCLVDLSYWKQSTPCNVRDLNFGSATEDASQSYDHQKCATNFRYRDDEPEAQCGEISSVNVRNYSGKEVNSTSFLGHQEKGHVQGLFSVGNRKRRSSMTNFETRQNYHCRDQRLQHSRKTTSMVNSDCFQSNSDKKSHHNTRDVHTWKRCGRVDEENMRMKAHHDSMAVKSRHRERSFDELYATSASYFYGEEERFMDKRDRFPSNSGRLCRIQQFDNYGKALPFGIERSYAYATKDLKIHEDGFHHPRIFEDTNYADQRYRKDRSLLRSQVHNLCKSDKKYSGHSRLSHARERICSLRNNHNIVSRNECCCFPSRFCTNCDKDHFPAKVKGVSLNIDAYSQRRKKSLDLPELLAEREVSFKHQSSNLSSTNRYTEYGTLQHQNIRVHKHSVSRPKFYDKYWSLSDSRDLGSSFRHQSSNLSTDRHTDYDVSQHQNTQVHKLSLRGGGTFYDNSVNDTDSMDLVGSLCDNFVKDRCELAESVCKESANRRLNDWKRKATRNNINNGSGIHACTEIALRKEKDSSHRNVKVKGTCSSQEAETEEFEEGQLIEESDDQQTVVKFNSNSNSNAASSDHKLVGRYDRNHLLETLAKMERRQERFKDPIPPKKVLQYGKAATAGEKTTVGMQLTRRHVNYSFEDEGPALES